MARTINRFDSKEIEVPGFWHAMPKDAETVEAEERFDYYNRKRYFGQTTAKHPRKLFEDWGRKHYVFD